MRSRDHLVGVIQRDRSAIVVASIVALALAAAEHFGRSLTNDWSGPLAVGVCLLAGLLVGRWWALALPVVAEALLSVLALTAPLPIPDPYLVGVVAVGVGLRRTGASLVRTRGRVGLGRMGLAGLLLYVSSAACFTILVLLVPESGLAGLAFVVLVAVHVVAGFAIGRWAALFLPVLLVLLAIPVPTDPEAYEPIPLWFAMLLWVAPIGACLLAVGVGARRLFERRWTLP